MLDLLVCSRPARRGLPTNRAFSQRDIQPVNAIEPAHSNIGVLLPLSSRLVLIAHHASSAQQTNRPSGAKITSSRFSCALCEGRKATTNQHPQTEQSRGAAERQGQALRFVASIDVVLHWEYLLDKARVGRLVFAGRRTTRSTAATHLPRPLTRKPKEYSEPREATKHRPQRATAPKTRPKAPGTIIATHRSP